MDDKRSEKATTATTNRLGGRLVETNEMNFCHWKRTWKFCEICNAYGTYVRKCLRVTVSTHILSLIFAYIFDCCSIMQEVYLYHVHYKLMLFLGIKRIHIKCAHEREKNIRHLKRKLNTIDEALSEPQVNSRQQKAKELNGIGF